MMRTAVIFIAISALAGLFFYGWKEFDWDATAKKVLEKRTTAAKMYSEGSVFVATRDIEIGERITAALIQQQPMDPSKIPLYADLGASGQIAFGKKVIHVVREGQILTRADLNMLKENSEVTTGLKTIQDGHAVGR